MHTNDASANEVTRLLGSIEQGDASGINRLLPLVYEELRSLASARIANEPAGLTLQPTALVHEAYLRLVREEGARWKSRAHFFSAAAEAMRRILVERARQRGRIKHGGGRRRLTIDDLNVASEDGGVDFVELDEVLTKLQAYDQRLSQVVEMRFFAGLGVEQVAELLDVAPRTIKRDWEFARAWLYANLAHDGDAEAREDA